MRKLNMNISFRENIVNKLSLNYCFRSDSRFHYFVNVKLTFIQILYYCVHYQTCLPALVSLNTYVSMSVILSLYLAQKLFPFVV